MRLRQKVDELWKRLPRAGRRQSTSRHARLGPVKNNYWIEWERECYLAVNRSQPQRTALHIRLDV